VRSRYRTRTLPKSNEQSPYEFLILSAWISKVQRTPLASPDNVGTSYRTALPSKLRMLQSYFAITKLAYGCVWNREGEQWQNGGSSTEVVGIYASIRRGCEARNEPITRNQVWGNRPISGRLSEISWSCRPLLGLARMRPNLLGQTVRKLPVVVVSAPGNGVRVSSRDVGSGGTRGIELHQGRTGCNSCP
jgi:hypothetical protein